jgi:putative colanic acid biosynthesis acetyltransferase WcaF
MIDLSQFNNAAFCRGAPRWKEFMWRLLQQGLFTIDWLKMYDTKRSILSCFGAQIEHGVVIKPNAKITFPWKLSIGANSWIGEEVWLLNLDRITIGANVCISQRSFLCTGNHNWSSRSFDLVTKPITVGNNVWICAHVFVGPGVVIGDNSVVTAGSVVTANLPPGMICSGNPCIPVKPRQVR